MPSELFLDELAALSVDDWRNHCILRFGSQRVPGGASEALRICNQTYFDVLRSEGKEIKIPKLLLLNDFLESVQPPPPAIAAGMLPANKLTIFGGAPKEGKGLVACQILSDIASSRAVLGRFDVQEIAPEECVVYFGMEDGAQEIKTRMEKRGDKDLPIYICADAVDMSKPEGFALFQTMIADLPQKPLLVVIDTLRKAYPSIRDYNDAAQVAPHISALCDWAHDHCAVVLIHHTNKNPLATGVNRLSGSNAVVSAADGFMILFDKNENDDDTVTWKLEAGGRGGIGGAWRIKGDWTNYHISVASSTEEDAAQRAERRDKLDAMKEQVLQYLRSTGGATARETADVLGAKQETVQKRFSELENDGAIQRTGKRTVAGSRKASIVYALAESKEENLTHRGSTSPGFSYIRGEKSPSSDAVETFFGSGESEEI